MSFYYTDELVKRLLEHYLDFQHTLYGQAQRLPDNAIRAIEDWGDDRPLGQTKHGGQAWPFMERRHATPPRDGKAKANKMLDIWVSMMDLEEAFKQMPDDVLELLYKYYVLQTHTLDELCIEFKTESRGSMSARLNRCVKRLRKALNNESLR